MAKEINTKDIKDAAYHATDQDPLVLIVCDNQFNANLLEGVIKNLIQKHGVVNLLHKLDNLK